MYFIFRWMLSPYYKCSGTLAFLSLVRFYLSALYPCTLFCFLLRLSGGLGLGTLFSKHVEHMWVSEKGIPQTKVNFDVGVLSWGGLQGWVLWTWALDLIEDRRLVFGFSGSHARLCFHHSERRQTDKPTLESSPNSDGWLFPLIYPIMHGAMLTLLDFLCFISRLWKVSKLHSLFVNVH